jgi:C4-dicarboxylate transporter DctM subunit
MLDICPNKFVFLLIVTVIFLILGMFLDTCVTILLLVPIFFPVAMAMGIDPVHFGLITVFNLSVGQETPPFGICLITAAGVSGLTIEEIVRNYIPYLLSDLFTLLLIVYIPQLTLLLPGLLIE